MAYSATVSADRVLAYLVRVPGATHKQIARGLNTSIAGVKAALEVHEVSADEVAEEVVSIEGEEVVEEIVPAQVSNVKSVTAAVRFDGANYSAFIVVYDPSQTKPRWSVGVDNFETNEAALQAAIHFANLSFPNMKVKVRKSR